MAEESESKKVVLSDRRVKALLRRINRIRGNYKKNIEYLRQEYRPVFKKSTHFDRTIVKEDFDTFDSLYEVIMSNPQGIKRNEHMQKLVGQFLKKYEFFGRYSAKTTEKRFNLRNRDEWLKSFRYLELDERVIDEIKKSGLWDNPNFWKGFFKSEFFIPLYQEYRIWEQQDIEEADLIKTWYGVEYSIWGKYLRKYLTRWRKLHKKE